MKNILKISVMYIVFGLVIGLTTHEIAYWTNFSGETVLSFVHAHALILGGWRIFDGARLDEGFSN